MRNIWIIARREYKLYFASPAAYLIAFMILLALGILFYLNLQVAAMQQFAPGVQITLAPMATGDHDSLAGRRTTHGYH